MRSQGLQRQILRALAGVVLLWTLFALWAKVKEYSVTQSAISEVSGRAFVTIVEREDDVLAAEFWVRSVYQSHGRSAHPILIIPTAISDESIVRLESVRAAIVTESMLQEYLQPPKQSTGNTNNKDTTKNINSNRSSESESDKHQISGFPVSFSNLQLACKDYSKIHGSQNCPYWRALVFSLGKYHTIAYSDPNIILLGNLSHLMKGKDSYLLGPYEKDIPVPSFFVWRKSHQSKSIFYNSFRQLEEGLSKRTPQKDPLTLLDVAIQYSLSIETVPKDVPYTLEKLLDFSKTHPISKVHPKGFIMYSWDKVKGDSQSGKSSICGPEPYSPRGKGPDAALWSLWHDVDSILNDVREPLVNAQEESDCRYIADNLHEHNFTAVVYSLGYNINRVVHMKTMIGNLSNFKECHKIILVWNTMQEASPSFLELYEKYPNLESKLVVKAQDYASPNNRFRPFKEIETRAVLVMNDNILLKDDDISLIFRTSIQLRKTLIGVDGELHHDFNGSWKILESKGKTYEYSMILPHVLAFDREYLYNYTCKMNKAIRNYVDSAGYCEDIALNMLIADATKIPPMLVEARPTIYNEADRVDVQTLKKVRVQCLNSINDLYNSKMPLKTTSNMIRPYFSNNVERFVMKSDGSIESVYVYYAHMANSASVYVLISCIVIYYVFKKSNHSIFR